MLVGEILIRKRYIEKKIDGLKIYLNGLKNSDVETHTKGALYSTTLKQVFVLFDKLQSHNALLDKENAETIIKITDSEVSVLDAVHILKTVKSKIDMFDSLIDSKDYSVGISDLMEKRDSLMEEYVVIRREVDKSDWSTSIE